MSSRISLAGSLPANLPWIIAAVGALLSITMAAVVPPPPARRPPADGRGGGERAGRQRDRVARAVHAAARDRADLPPLLLSGSDARFIALDVGAPIGVRAGADYSASTVAVPPGATVLGFTDGLVERRGEDLDAGLERLRTLAAATGGGTADELLEELVLRLAPAPARDDVAIVAMRNS